MKILSIGVCGTDLHAYRGNQPFFNYPRILGHEITGEYVSGGRDDIQQGEFCSVMPYISCGHCYACRLGKTNCCLQIKVCGVHIDGAMCEYYQVPDELVIASEGLSIDETALLEPLAVAAHGIGRAGPIGDSRILIIGAGPIGMGLIIMAKYAGAQVWLMDVNQDRLDFAYKNYQIDRIWRADEKNLTDVIREASDGDMLPVVIDASGNLQAIENGLNYLSHGGQYILVGLQKQAFNFSHPEFHKREATLKSSRNATIHDFLQVKKAILDKSIDVSPLITHRLPFEQVRTQFESLYNPANRVIKAVIDF